MDSLAGMPDFQLSLTAGESQVFAPFESGSYNVLPRRIKIAVDGAGQPKFQLVLAKGLAGDVVSARQYAELGFCLGGEFPLDEALTACRAVAAGAMVRGATINQGFASLYSTTASVVLPSEVTTPRLLGDSPPDLARFTVRLPVDGGELLKGALSSSSLLLGARVEVEVMGIAPRVGVWVEFDPVPLLGAMLARGSGRQISGEDLLQFFTGPIEGMPLKLIGTMQEGDIGVFPQAMADRIAGAYSVMCPSPTTFGPGFRLFSDPQKISGGKVQWDLSRPVAVPRQWVYMLDAADGLQAISGAGAAGALVREVTIPALNLGYSEIDIAANLPTSRIGVPAIGVNISIAANPPWRSFPINPTVTFTPPEDRGNVQLRISPAEKLNYGISGFAVVVAGSSVRQYSMASRVMTDTWVQLQSTDFPVSFAHVSAAERLMKLCEIAGTLTYTMGATAMSQALR